MKGLKQDKSQIISGKGVIPGVGHLALIFLVSVALRWAYVSGYNLAMEHTLSNFHRSHAVSAFMFGDAESYFTSAMELAKTHSAGLPYRPPLTIFLLAMALKIGSMNHLTAHLWQLLLGSLIPVLFAALTARWFTTRAGIICGWLTATAFPLLILSGTISSEPLLLVLVAAALLCLESSRPVVLALAGAFMGLALLTRPEIAICLVPILIWQIFFRRDCGVKTRLLVPLLLFCVVFPWSLRNTLLLHDRYPDWPIQRKIVPISANGALNFFLGNGPMASGGYRSFSNAMGENRHSDTINFNDPLHRRAFFNGYEAAMEYLYIHPDRFPPLLMNKLRFFTRGYRTGWGLYNSPWGLRGYLRRGDIWTTENAAAGAVLLFIWHLGMIAGWRTNRRGLIFSILFILTGLISAVIFFGLARNAVMSLPFMFAAIGCLVDRLYTSRFNPIPEHHRKRMGMVVTVCIALFFTIQAITLACSPQVIMCSNKIFSVMNSPGDENSTRQGLILKYEQTLEHLNSLDEVIIFEEALSSFYVGLGYCINGDDPERVEKLIELALTYDPANAEAWKLRGTQAIKEPEKLIEAIRAFERYLEISPRASDAQQIKKVIGRNRVGF